MLASLLTVVGNIPAKSFYEKRPEAHLLHPGEKLNQSDKFGFPAGLQILLVDDDPGFRQKLRTALEEWGCSITEAGDGMEALEILKDLRDVIVISDIDMPGMDGLSLLHWIRTRFGGVPVIMLSGMIHERIVDEAMSLGAVGYLQKPFRLTELKSHIHSVIRLREPKHAQE